MGSLTDNSEWLVSGMARSRGSTLLSLHLLILLSTVRFYFRQVFYIHWKSFLNPLEI